MISRFIVCLMVCVVVWPVFAEAKVQVKTVPYKKGEISFEGLMAWDDAHKGKRPGILVIHEWWGLNDYAKKRAEQLAALGYVAFAVDMYGKGNVTTHPDKASQWMKETTANIEMWQARAQEGLNILQADPRVDPTKLAAIGYCFGGATVMQMVYSGAPVQGVVSFHGSLPLPPASPSIKSSAKILIAHGDADSFLPPDQVSKFTTALDGAGLDWQVHIYGGAQHSFTNPSANDYGVKGLQYQKQADQRSWKQMNVFFDVLFE